MWCGPLGAAGVGVELRADAASASNSLVAAIIDGFVIDCDDAAEPLTRSPRYARALQQAISGFRRLEWQNQRQRSRRSRKLILLWVSPFRYAATKPH